MSGAGPVFVYEPELVEEAVLRALRSTGLERRYQIERERCYAITDPEDRDQAFRRLFHRLFQELTLDRPLIDALLKRPHIAASIETVAIARAPSSREEGADLFARPDGEPGRRFGLGVALTADTLAAAPAMKRLLDRELLHIDDLLDPGFGYDPAEARPRGPAIRQNLTQGRYRLLWRASVLSRLVREGLEPAAAYEAAQRELQSAFPAAGAALDEFVARLHAGVRPTHQDMLDLAERGRAAADDGQGPQPGSACALCGFPTYGFEASPETIPAAALSEIRADFPAWTTKLGLCPQCADLYRARHSGPSLANKEVA